jgi:hypothetical protein
MFEIMLFDLFFPSTICYLQDNKTYIINLVFMLPLEVEYPQKVEPEHV